MKIQCDVCGKEEASIFCCADEAVLCDACDCRVHKANKLAGKHRRFSLLGPTTGQAPPVCDVCQVKTGYIFCQEDRAILCKECDEPIHGTNNLTMKHNRFLLAGARLSIHPLSSNDSDSNSNEENQEKKKEIPLNKEKESGVLITTKVSGQTRNSFPGNGVTTNNGSSISGKPSPGNGVTTSNGSSISEYLTKVCPGWHVEDLLVDDAAVAAASAVKGNLLTPFLEADLESGSFDPPMWVPQSFDFTTTNINQCQNPWMGSVDVGSTIQMDRNCWNADDMFTVPQMSPRKAVQPNKRARSSFLYY
ncbi:hypothetical protein LUZ60_007153 [Juncus effusus]|nr:hypothetical protein LUZ60_007153 [Juncus effusus]